MSIFLRAVVTGFGMSLGAALFKRVARQLGLDEPEDKARDQVERTPAEPVTES
jgi:hypothetical protein